MNEERPSRMGRPTMSRRIVRDIHEELLPFLEYELPAKLLDELERMVEAHLARRARAMDRIKKREKYWRQKCERMQQEMTDAD